MSGGQMLERSNELLHPSLGHSTACQPLASRQTPEWQRNIDKIWCTALTPPPRCRTLCKPPPTPHRLPKAREVPGRSQDPRQGETARCWALLHAQLPDHSPVTQTSLTDVRGMGYTQIFLIYSAHATPATKQAWSEAHSVFPLRRASLKK